MDEKRNQECLRRYQELKPLLTDYIDLYAQQTPTKTAIIEVNTGETVSYKDFRTKVDAFAAKLLAMGLKRGDIIATSLPFLKEHIFLEYGAFKIGVVVAPLDLRLKAQEILYSLRKIKPKAYFFLGKTEMVDFRPLIKEVMSKVSFVEHWVQFQKEEAMKIMSRENALVNRKNSILK
jgi:acyl-CoA synthetase (AMP-forming)/AMP-acid ligase II